MLLNDGVCHVYAIRHGKQPQLKPVTRAWWGEQSITMGEHYTANAHGIKVERRIRIWQDRRVRPGMLVLLNKGRSEELYEAGRVYHGKDEDGLPITDISLSYPSQAAQLAYKGGDVGG